jgi:hypothetical protein
MNFIGHSGFQDFKPYTLNLKLKTFYFINLSAKG